MALPPWQQPVPFKKYIGIKWREPRIATVGFGGTSIIDSWERPLRECNQCVIKTPEDYYVVLQCPVNLLTLKTTKVGKLHWCAVDASNGTLTSNNPHSEIFQRMPPWADQFYNPDEWSYAVDKFYPPPYIEAAFAIAAREVARMGELHEAYRRYWADKTKTSHIDIGPEEVLKHYGRPFSKRNSED